MPPMKIRDLILGATARRYAVSEFTVNGQPCKVGLRSLTEEELTKYEMARGGAKTPAELKIAQANQRRRLIVLTCVELDADGKPTDTLVFSTEDVIALERVDAGIAAILYHDAQSHIEGPRTPVEDIAKNSETTVGDS